MMITGRSPARGPPRINKDERPPEANKARQREKLEGSTLEVARENDSLPRK